jgi:hypothetical protein
MIVEHPDAAEIVNKLLSGINAKDVSAWLKLKYSKKEESHLKLSVKLLKDFAESEYCNLENQYMKDLTTVQSGGKIDKKLSASLMNNKSYQERLMEVADKDIDVKKMLVGLIKVCQDRAEQVFDKIQENNSSFKPDYVMIKYFELLLNMIEKFDRIVNHSPDIIVQNNISVQAIDNYTNVLQDAVRDILGEMDPSLSTRFLDLLYDKMKELNLPPPSTPLTSDQKTQQVSILQEKVLNTENT